MKKTTMGICCVMLVALSLSSCDNFFSAFTTSMGKGAARDMTAAYAKQDASKLVALLNTSAAQTPETAKQITNALAGKSKDELNALSTEDKTTLLNTVTTAMLPINSLGESVNTLLNNNTTPTNDDVKSIMDKIDGGVNTDAVTMLLSTPATVNALPPSTLAIASATLLAGIAKSEGVTDMSKITDKIKGAGGDQGLDASTTDIVTALTSGQDALNTSNKDELTAVINVFKALSGKSPEGDYADRSSENITIGGQDVSSYLKDLGK